MEHKLLIGGGEEYLPFARSRIRALKALGYPYMDQSFEVGDASVKVRIEPGHEYIKITGGIEIHSGIVKYGDNPPGTKILKSFRPTRNTWEKVLGRKNTSPPTHFTDDKFLLRSGKFEATQYRDIAPSMFSGLMAKAVAVLMGRGIEVKYDYHWDLCHGVTMSTDGKPWVVEISRERGILATRLKTVSASAKDRVDAKSVSAKLFGGIPDMGAFPADEALTQALETGAVIRLATASAMAPYFACIPHAANVGWSFGEALSVAYNVVAATEERMYFEIPYTHYTGKLFKLTFSISGNTGSATLTEEESGELVIEGGQVMPMRFDLPSVSDPVRAYHHYGLPPAVGTPLAPIFVCHIGDVLEVIRLDYTREFTPGEVYFREIVEGNYPSHGSGVGEPYLAYVPPSDTVVEMRTYKKCKVTGTKVIARSRTDKVVTTYEAVTSYVGFYTNYIVFKVTRVSTLTPFVQWVSNNYRSRDTLVQFDETDSTVSRYVQDYYGINRGGHTAETSYQSGGFNANPAHNGFDVYPDMVSSPPSGQRGVIVGGDVNDPVWMDTYDFRTHPALKVDVFWASGAVTRCTDITRTTVNGAWLYEERDAASNGVQRFLEEQILPSEIPPTSERQFVVAIWPAALFSDGLSNEQDYPGLEHPRVQYTFIGASGVYSEPAVPPT